MKLRTHLARIKKKVKLNFLSWVDALKGTDHAIRFKMKLWGFDTNDYRFREDQVAFIHMPKTGGSTLSRLLSADPENRFVNLKLHRPVSRHCAPGDYHYITVLRHPVDRVWSLYQMTLHDPDGHHYRKWAEKGLKFFLEKYWASRNLYCRYFSGSVFSEPGDVEKEQALKNMNAFDEVLMFSDLENEINDLLAKYGIEAETIPHLRKSKNQKATEAEAQLISEYNALDIELYESWINKRENVG